MAGPGGVHGADVVVVGGVGVDTIVRVPVLPVPWTDTVHVPPIVRTVGHTGTGWALGLHALGMATVLVDLVGDDPEADLARRCFAAAGVPFRAAVVPEGTKRSVNLVDPDGGRLSFYDGRGQRLDGVAPALWLEPLATARHAHISINDTARPALRAAHELGLTVSTDLHDWDGDATHHEEFAAGADLVLMSATALGGRQDVVAARIADLGRARVVVVTAGERGCTVYQRDAAPVVVPAAALSQQAEPGQLDANGAGDAFGAAFLTAWLRGENVAVAARWGAVAGAHACSGTGTAPLDLARLRTRLGRVPPGQG